MTESGITTTNAPGMTWEVSIRPTKTWKSFEQFRQDGGPGLIEAVGEGCVGYLQVRNEEFAILRKRDFGRLVGLAHDVRRMSKGILLLKQAAELVIRSPDQELAVSHLRELSVTFPDIVISTSRAEFGDLEIEGQADTGFDVSSYEPPRAPLAVAG